MAEQIEPVGSWMQIFQRLPAIAEFARYGLASAAALVIDFGLLLMLTELFGWHYLVSAAIGFTAGCVFLYALSISVIFKHRNIGNARAEFVAFAGIGMAGLILTQLLMYTLVSLAGLIYPLAKLITVCVTFIFNFGMRKTMLFRHHISPGV